MLRNVVGRSVAGLVLLAGCASSEGASRSSSASTPSESAEVEADVSASPTVTPTEVPPTTTVASTSTVVAATVGSSIEPVDFATAVVTRLTDEFGDAAIAEEVIAAVGPETLGRLEARVPAGDVATSSFLSYRPATVAADGIDSVIGYSFGFRESDDGTLTPGPPNEAIAAEIAAFVADHPVPVFAQHEIAQVLQAAGVGHVVSIEPDIGANGEVVYLSTAGVAARALELASAAGIELGTTGVFGFADHLGRCVLTTEAVGIAAVVPAGVDAPAVYDPESVQPWTRDRVTYLTIDLIGRLETL